jgi:undecaprenyl-diphosphatase
MSVFDLSVFKLLFAFVHWCPALGAVLKYVVNDDFLKGAVLLSFFWWLWFSDDKHVYEKHELLLFAFVSSSVAVLLGRLLALCVPFRLRPMDNLTYNFPFPTTAPSEIPHSWNSFPSDHAILFFCLAACLSMVSRRTGILALCHTLFVICIPRIYMGYHYPSDIAAGALLGIGLALLGKCTWLRKVVTRRAFLWIDRHPASFYAAAFLWTFEVAELFRTLLNLASFVRHHDL